MAETAAVAVAATVLNHDTIDMHFGPIFCIVDSVVVARQLTGEDAAAVASGSVALDVGAVDGECAVVHDAAAVLVGVAAGDGAGAVIFRRVGIVAAVVDGQAALWLYTDDAAQVYRRIQSAVERVAVQVERDAGGSVVVDVTDNKVSRQVDVIHQL